MEEGYRSETLVFVTRENPCVAGTENLVAGIPLAVLVETPVVDVPLAIVGVPVDVHHEHSVPRTIPASTL